MIFCHRQPVNPPTTGPDGRKGGRILPFAAPFSYMQQTIARKGEGKNER